MEQGPTRVMAPEVSVEQARFRKIKRAVLLSNGKKRTLLNTKRLSKNKTANAWKTSRRRNLPLSRAIDFKMIANKKSRGAECARA